MALRTSSARRGTTLAALLAAAALTLSGCGGDDDSPDDGGDDPAAVLDTAATTLDDTSGLEIALETDGLPDGVSAGVEKAMGVGTHAPAFDGTITVLIAGQSVDVPVVAVDGKVYAKIPFTPEGYTDIDPGDYGAPDPAVLLGKGTGFSALLPATTAVEKGKTVRGGEDNKEVLTEYTGTVPDEAVKGIIPSASGDFDATYTITDDGELRQAELTGAFYGDDHDATTYTIDFDEYGSTPDIKKP